MFKAGFLSGLFPNLMPVLSGEVVREIPASPLFFGIFTFGVLALLLYLTLRIDRD
jgi:hypothetical protein